MWLLSKADGLNDEELLLTQQKFNKVTHINDIVKDLQYRILGLTYNELGIYVVNSREEIFVANDFKSRMMLDHFLRTQRNMVIMCKNIFRLFQDMRLESDLIYCIDPSIHLFNVEEFIRYYKKAHARFPIMIYKNIINQFGSIFSFNLRKEIGDTRSQYAQGVLCFDIAYYLLEDILEKEGWDSFYANLNTEGSIQSYNRLRTFSFIQRVKLKQLKAYRYAVEVGRQTGTPVTEDQRIQLIIKYESIKADLKRKLSYFGLGDKDNIYRDTRLKDFVTHFYYNIISSGRYGRSSFGRQYNQLSEKEITNARKIVGWLSDNTRNLKSIGYGLTRELLSLEWLDVPVLRLAYDFKQACHMLYLLQDNKNLTIFSDYHMPPNEWIVFKPEHHDKEVEKEFISILHLKDSGYIVDITEEIGEFPQLTPMLLAADVETSPETTQDIYTDKIEEWVLHYYQKLNELLESDKVLTYIGANYLVADSCV